MRRLIIHPGARRGFSLLEMLLTTAIIAVAAITLAPALSDENRARVIAAAQILTSDLEMAQVMNVSYPDQPVVVRFDPDNHQYWLAYASDTETPINRPDTGEPYLIVFGVGRAAGAAGVEMTLDDITDSLGFSSQGGVTDYNTNPAITLSLAGNSITLEIAPTTGSISEAE
jgi:prepilin-type N-terminal cleavage/methylation domain-containing protein